MHGFHEPVPADSVHHTGNLINVPSIQTQEGRK